jgi:glycine cleavage system H protein
MSEKKFSKKHEWVSIEGEIATIGITKHATELLGDIVFVEVPEAGKAVEKDGQAAVVESTKAASDVYSPISGEITEGNKSIVDDPVSVNTDPEGASWFFKLKVKDKSEFDGLMSQSDYEKFVTENPS